MSFYVKECKLHPQRPVYSILDSNVTLNFDLLNSKSVQHSYLSQNASVVKVGENPIYCVYNVSECIHAGTDA